MKKLNPILLILVASAGLLMACYQTPKKTKYKHYPIWDDSIPTVIVSNTICPKLNLKPTKDSSTLGYWYVCLYQDSHNKRYEAVTKIFTKDGAFYVDEYEIVNDSLLLMSEKKPKLSLENFGPNRLAFKQSKNDPAGYFLFSFLVYDSVENKMYYYNELFNRYEGVTTYLATLDQYKADKTAYIERCKKNDSLTIVRCKSRYSHVFRIYSIDNKIYLQEYGDRTIVGDDEMRVRNVPNGLRLDYKAGSSYYYLLTKDSLLECWIDNAHDKEFSHTKVENWDYSFSKFDSVFYLRDGIEGLH